LRVVGVKLYTAVALVHEYVTPSKVKFASEGEFGKKSITEAQHFTQVLK